MIKGSVLIGRFQPFHLGHLYVLRKALKMADQCLVVIGSDGKLRSLKNPWTSEEREGMIYKSLTAEEQHKIRFVWQEDRPGKDKQWAEEIQYKARNAIWSFSQDVEFTLVGAFKGGDTSTYYLNENTKLFPSWKFESIVPERIINATDIRETYFGGEGTSDWGSDLTSPSYVLLKRFKTLPMYGELVKSREPARSSTYPYYHGEF